MLLAITLAMLLAPAALPEPHDPALVDTIVRVGCRGHHPTRAMVVELLDIERDAGITGPARGLIAAAACNESGFRPHARGDWYSQVDRGARCRNGAPQCAPTSLGMFQLGSWAKRKLRRMGASTPEPRFDWRVSARFWARHVVAQVPRVREVCPTLRKGWDAPSELDVWRAAHRTAVVKPKCGEYRVRNGRQRCIRRVPRCHRIGARYKSSHWRILASWKGDKAPAPEKWKGYPRAVRDEPRAAVVP
jgi:hypothetical protein